MAQPILHLNAIFNITTNNGFAYGTYGTGTTTIEENASLTLKQTAANGSYATWYSYGTITLNENSNLKIINDFENIKTTNYNISFQTTSSGLIINNPNEVILYNKAANIIATANTIPFSFTFSRLNLFNTTIDIKETISENTLPTFSWYTNTKTSKIQGTFSNQTTIITEHNYTEEELANLPDIKNLIFPNKKILSIGTVKLKLNAITDTDTTITGTTDKNASMLISYNNQTNTVLTDTNGNFTHALTETLPIGTIITITIKQENYPIYYTKQVQIIYSGDLIIDSVPTTITFDLVPISTNPIICPKKIPLEIVITDSRINETTWNLYASIEKQPTSSSGITLKNALIYKNENNEINELTETKTLIATGTKEKEETKITTITQDTNIGILLQILEEIKNNTEYKTKIIWEIE